MKKVILHIGQYKTGSSSIQNFLNNETEYLAKHHVQYCASGLLKNEPEVGIRHYKLSINTKSENCYWPALVDEINNSDAELFIVSYENLLFGLDDEQLAYVANLLQPFEVQVICYLRRQDAFLSSWYAELIKSHKCKMPVAAFINNNRHLGMYGEALCRWATYFAPKNMSVISFEQLKANQLNVIESFFSLLGLPVPNDLQRYQENASLGAQGVANMLAFNRKVDTIREIHRKVSKFFIEYYQDDPRFKLFTAENAQKFVQSFAQDHAKLTLRFNLPQDFFSTTFDYPEPQDFDPTLGRFMAQLVTASKVAAK